MKIKFICGGKTAEAELRGQVTLLSAAVGAGVVVYAPCGGYGRCGGCRVLASGALSAPDPFERKLLGDAELARGVRLACRATATGEGDVTVVIPESPSAAHTDRATAGADSRRKVGAAVDIGTTTVAASLVDTDTGERLAEASAPNPQSVYGADVISRIGAVRAAGMTALTGPIRACVDALLRRVGAKEDTPKIIVGNTVMTSLWAGVDPTPIGTSPFMPTDLFGRSVDGAYLPRCVSGYFGSDALASVAAALGVHENDGELAVLDMGTNGEAAVIKGGRMYACAAAAGPALEGGGISCGMTASVGAVDSAAVRGGEIRCHVIGGGEAKGICGSGLIDAVACMLMLGHIDKSGTFVSGDSLALADGVAVTQKDVRAFQLAKGAVRAALNIVLDDGRRGFPRLYLSGAFGTGMSVRSCVRTGILPGAYAENGGENVVILGNGALRGAELMLADARLLGRMESLAENAVYEELSGSERFAAEFMAALDF